MYTYFLVAINDYQHDFTVLLHSDAMSEISRTLASRLNLKQGKTIAKLDETPNRFKVARLTDT